jgi:hypothetical protein
MKKYFALKTFRRWLAREGHRFRHRPLIQFVRREYFILRFSGITPKISCIISKSGRVEIWARHRKECWDILSEFDVSERRNDYSQYLCQLCDMAFRNGDKPEPPEMFTSREELWIKHSFEPLLEWCNEHFQRGRILFFQGRESSYTYAVIKSQEELGKMNAHEDFVCACPVVLRDACIPRNGR